MYVAASDAAFFTETLTLQVTQIVSLMLAAKAELIPEP